MGTIRTVTGDIASTSLGHCQCHEHLYIAKGKACQCNPALWMDDTEATTAEVLRYRDAGGGALVDAQPTGACAMPEALAETSRRTGVRIIASTGFQKPEYYPEGHWIFTTGENTIAELFTADIAQGLAVDADTNIPKRRTVARAGVIKCAMGTEGLDSLSRRLFKAAARASRTTGAPLLIHTENGAHAVALVRFLTDEGIEPRRLLLCHIERSLANLHEKIEIARTGAYLQCDTIGRYKYHSDEDEASFLKMLCDEGYEKRILIGLDTTRTRLKSYGGATGLDHILTDFLPLLAAKGFSREQLKSICVTNPAEALQLAS